MAQTIPAAAGWYLDEYDGPRFWRNVDFHGGYDYLNDPIVKLAAAAGECWNWTGRLKGHEAMMYGNFRLAGHESGAHRIALLEFNVKIPDGYDVDHLCRRTVCVRPSHLEPVTHQENMRRGAKAQAETCASGHPWDAANTRWQDRDGRPIRLCRACIRIYRHEHYLRRKAS